jgi:hypothetical protein
MIPQITISATIKKYIYDSKKDKKSNLYIDKKLLENLWHNIDIFSVIWTPKSTLCKCKLPRLVVSYASI